MKMAGASCSVFGLAAFLVAIVVLISSSEAEFHTMKVSCKEVTPVITPCGSYLMGTVAKPSKECCNGVKTINDKFKSKNDRVDVCNCIKQVVSQGSKYDPNRIPMIPKQCGFSFSLPPMGKGTDCSKVAFDSGDHV